MTNTGARYEIAIGAIGMADWLVEGFTVLGIFIQNWMVIVAIGVALWVAYLWVTGQFRASSNGAAMRIEFFRV